jgi:hypothetical protein
MTEVCCFAWAGEFSSRGKQYVPTVNWKQLEVYILTGTLSYSYSKKTNKNRTNDLQINDFY